MIAINNKQYQERESSYAFKKTEIYENVIEMLSPYYPYTSQFSNNIPMIVSTDEANTLRKAESNCYYNMIVSEFQLIQNKESNLSFSNREKVEKCFNHICEEVK